MGYKRREDKLEWLHLRPCLDAAQSGVEYISSTFRFMDEDEEVRINEGEEPAVPPVPLVPRIIDRSADNIWQPSKYLSKLEEISNTALCTVEQFNTIYQR